MSSIYLLFFFSSLKTHTDQNKKFCSTRSFTLSEKKATHKSSKIAAAKKAFLIGATCFDESFLFSVITGRHWKFSKVYCYSEFLLPLCCCFLTNKRFERGPYFTSVFYVISTMSVQFQNKAVVYYTWQNFFFFFFFFFDKAFYILLLCDYSSFFFIAK